MTHPLDKPLGPRAQEECHWSYHNGTRMVYDLMCLYPMSKSDAQDFIETTKLALGMIARAHEIEVADLFLEKAEGK